jgi:hypothetical protein
MNFLAVPSGIELQRPLPAVLLPPMAFRRLPASTRLALQERIAPRAFDQGAGGPLQDSAAGGNDHRRCDAAAGQPWRRGERRAGRIRMRHIYRPMW